MGAVGAVAAAGKEGGPAAETKRQLIDGIRWRIRTGCPWWDIPDRYGPWQTVYGLFRRWQRGGVWAQIRTRVQALADAAGGLTQHRTLRTTALTTMIEAIGLAVAGHAGARLAARLGVHVSRDTLLGGVRAISDRSIQQTSILGIDDFALRRGHVYGTVIVDLTSGRPVDLLPDRASDTVSTWLQAHPGAEIVCRD
ncbi:transposase [Rhodococcus aetherivorans]